MTTTTTYLEPHGTPCLICDQEACVCRAAGTLAATPGAWPIDRPTDSEPERPAYRPGMARVGEPTPQTDPELFTDSECEAEARHLDRLNQRHGWHPLRQIAADRLRQHVANRTR